MNLNISSVTERAMQSFFKQLIWFGLSLLVMFYAYRILDLQKLKKYIPILTIINLILVVLVLYIGIEVKGATRSFSFAGVNFQPSLLMRVMLILYFARFLDKKKEFLKESSPKGFVKYFLPLIIITSISYIAIIFQRHFSVIIISAATLFSILWIVKVRSTTLTLIILIGVVSVVTVLSLGASYRGSRIEIYTKYSLFHRILGQDVDSIQADDYQIRESLISLSQGGFWGISSVFGQAKNRYLPESNTDYVYSVIGEEYGFVGGVFILILYVIIFYRGTLRSWKQNDLYLRLAGIGLTLNIFFNALVNIGVAISALPSTGVTLPFISYGGTSLVVNSLCIGLILNIIAVRKPCHS